MAAVGVPVGCAVRGGQPLYGSFEDMHLDVWGPRTGKTTSRAVPAILEAPGAVFVTSNKRDVVDATRDPRSAIGSVRVFDPQGIALEEFTWWWNPLSYVTDEVRAAKMAEHFASGSREQGSRADAYFDNAGQDLLAGLLLAAALDQRPITDVYVWLTRPTDETPVEILKRQQLPVDRAPGRRRDRGTGEAARRRVRHCAADGRLPDQQPGRPLVTPANGGYDSRRQFDPAEFVRGHAGRYGTLYSLSKEGRGTAGPWSPRLPWPRPPRSWPRSRPTGASRCRCSGSSTRPRTCAGGVSCPTCTATTAPAGWSLTRLP